MRTILPIVALMLGVAARAQVTVEISMEQQQVLRSESLPVRIKISNSSGQALKLGGTQDWLSFSVETREGKAMSKTGEIPLPKPFTIENARSVSLKVDLMPSFNLSEAGHYAVTARLKLPQLEQEAFSDPKPFDVITGLELWKQDFGLPGRTPPEMRRYSLLQATFLQQQRLYLRVTGVNDSQVIRVTPLGDIVSFSHNTVEPVFDRMSHLHVLFQTGRNTFAYCVATPDGNQLIRQTFEQAVQGSSRPHLKLEDDGRVMVTGGQRRVSATDLPPPNYIGTNSTVSVK
jgi:hypothetical protein